MLSRRQCLPINSCWQTSKYTRLALNTEIDIFCHDFCAQMDFLLESKDEVLCIECEQNDLSLGLLSTWSKLCALSFLHKVTRIYMRTIDVAYVDMVVFLVFSPCELLWRQHLIRFMFTGFAEEISSIWPAEQWSFHAAGSNIT